MRWAVPAASVLGFLAGLGASVPGFDAVERQTRFHRSVVYGGRSADTVMVMIHAADRQAGTLLSASDLMAVETPPDLLPDGVLLSPDEVVGRMLSEDVFADELVRVERLTDAAPGTRVALEGRMMRRESSYAGTDDPRALVRQAVERGHWALLGLRLRPGDPAAEQRLQLASIVPEPLPPIGESPDPLGVYTRLHDLARVCASLARSGAEVTERPVPRADHVDRITTWAGDRVSAEALATWAAGPPLVACDGGQPLDLAAFDALWP